MLTLGTGIGGGLVARTAQLYRGRHGLGGRARAHGRRAPRARLPGRLPRDAAASRRSSRGPAIGARGRGARPRPARTRRSGRRLAAGRRSTAASSPSWPTTGDELAPRGRWPSSGERLGVGLVGLVNALQPRGDRDRRRRGRGRRAAAGAGPRGGRRARAAAARRGACGSCRPTSATRRGCSGAALLALEALGMSGRLVVCPTPIGNLEDVTLRVLSALREADVVACEDTRRTRVLLDRYGVKRAARLLPRAQRGGARRRSSSSGCAAARWWRWSRTPACRSCPTPATCWCGRASRPGCRWRCCRGRRRRSPRWWRPRCRPDEWRFARLPAAQEGRAARAAVASRAGRWSRSSRRAGVPATLALLAELDPEREVAVCRELTKVARGGRARHRRRAGRALRRRRRRRARSCWCWRRRRRRRRRAAAGRPPRLDALRRAGRRGRQAAARRRGRGRALTGGERERAVPRARPPSNRTRTARATPRDARARTVPAAVTTVAPDRGRSLRRSCAASSLSRSLACSRRPAVAAAGVGLAGRGRGHHAVSQRRRPLCGRAAPRDRHRGAGRHAGRRGGGGRRALRGHGRLLGAHRQRPHGRRRFDTSYLHLSSLAVRAGRAVGRGRARSARSARPARARPTAPHLHFGVREAGSRHGYRDPLAFLPPPPAAPRAGTRRRPRRRPRRRRGARARRREPAPAARRRPGRRRSPARPHRRAVRAPAEAPRPTRAGAPARAAAGARAPRAVAAHAPAPRRAGPSPAPREPAGAAAGARPLGATGARAGGAPRRSRVRPRRGHAPAARRGRAARPRPRLGAGLSAACSSPRRSWRSPTRPRRRRRARLGRALRPLAGDAERPLDAAAQ